MLIHLTTRGPKPRHHNQWDMPMLCAQVEQALMFRTGIWIDSYDVVDLDGPLAPDEYRGVAVFARTYRSGELARNFNPTRLPL